MATQFEIDCALMAGASYISTRPEENRFPIPTGWEVVPNSYSNGSTSGFEAIAFRRGSEIVISYAGTDPGDITGDIAADTGLATGYGSAQLTQAAEYYLLAKALNSNASITFTGHSLGGGLAALMGVFFGNQAVTFDQAPFANSAELNLLTPNVAANLRSDLAAKVDNAGNRLYDDAALSGLSNFLALRQTNGGIPNSNLVSTIRVDGEFLGALPFTLIGAPATTLTHGDYVGPIDLHSQALRSAFLQSDAFRQMTSRLPELLGMVSNNLEVSIIGTDDKFSLSNWYLGSQYHVEQFKTSDGKTLLDSQVQNLVDAMASFSPPAAGETSLSASYASALSPVIVANWQ